MFSASAIDTSNWFFLYRKFANRGFLEGKYWILGNQQGRKILCRITLGRVCVGSGLWGVSMGVSMGVGQCSFGCFYSDCAILWLRIVGVCCVRNWLNGRSIVFWIGILGIWGLKRRICYRGSRGRRISYALVPVVGSWNREGVGSSQSKFLGMIVFVSQSRRAVGCRSY